MNKYDQEIQFAVDQLSKAYPDKIGEIGGRTITYDGLVELKTKLVNDFKELTTLIIATLYFKEAKEKLKKLADGSMMDIANINLHHCIFTYKINRLLSLIDNPDINFVCDLDRFFGALITVLDDIVSFNNQEFGVFSSLLCVRLKNKQISYEEHLALLNDLYAVLVNKNDKVLKENDTFLMKLLDYVIKAHPVLKEMMEHEVENRLA